MPGQNREKDVAGGVTQGENWMNKGWPTLAKGEKAQMVRS